MRIQRVVLKHHRDVAILGLQIVDDFAVDPDFAVSDRLQARDHAQQRGFAATGRAYDHDEFTIGDGEIDAVYYVYVAVGFFDLFEFNLCHTPHYIKPMGRWRDGRVNLGENPR